MTSRKDDAPEAAQVISNAGTKAKSRGTSKGALSCRAPRNARRAASTCALVFATQSVRCKSWPTTESISSIVVSDTGACGTGACAFGAAAGAGEDSAPGAAEGGAGTGEAALAGLSAFTAAAVRAFLAAASAMALAGGEGTSRLGVPLGMVLRHSESEPKRSSGNTT